MAAAATRGDALRITDVSNGEIRHLHAIGTIPGVAIVQAAGFNGPGTGTLRSTGDGTLLSWREPGSATWGEAVDAGADGTYLLEGGDEAHAWVRVQVYASYLLPTPTSVSVYLADVYGNDVSGDDVTAAEAAAGSVEYIEMRIHNDSGAQVQDVRLWIDPSMSGLQIREPPGGGWSAPTSEVTALVLTDIAAGNYERIEVRRTITAGAGSDPRVLNLLHLAWQGL